MARNLFVKPNLEHCFMYWVDFWSPPDWRKLRRVREGYSIGLDDPTSKEEMVCFQYVCDHLYPFSKEDPKPVLPWGTLIYVEYEDGGAEIKTTLGIDWDCVVAFKIRSVQ